MGSRITIFPWKENNVVDLRIKKNWPYGGPLLKSGTNRLGMSALRKNIMMAL
jgi:hypothetical protein